MAETPTPKAGLPGSAVSRSRHAGGTTSAHPEANLLAAFSEQALTPPERGEVLIHLAQCADCREIVTLALPPDSDIPQTAVAASPGWFGLRRWANPEFMRWGVVGASAAVVVAAVLLVKPELRMPESRTAGMTATVANPQRPVEKDITQTKGQSAESNYSVGTRPAEIGRADSLQQAPAKDYALNDASKAPSALTAKPVAPLAPPPPPPRVAGGHAIDGVPESRAIGGVGAGSGAGIGAGKAVAGRDQSAEVATVHKLESRPAPVVDSAAKRADAESSGARSDNQALGKDASKEKVEAADVRAGPAVTSEFAKLGTFSKPEQAKLEPAKNEAKAASAKQAEAEADTFRLADTDDGHVAQRSADETAGFKPSSPKRRPQAFNGAPLTWRVIDGRLQSSGDGGRNWENVTVDADVRILAVDSGYPLPSSVWAGAAAGIVLRSTDNGVTWSRVGPLTGDVVYLKFADAKNGVLRIKGTGGAEEWSTVDGGVTWKKR